MSYNRASYQRINPNLSTKQVVKQKQAVLCFTDGDAMPAFLEISEKNLRKIAKFWPEMTPSALLIAMLNGKSFYLSGAFQTVSIAYK